MQGEMLSKLKRLLVTGPKAVYEIVRYKGVRGTSKAILRNLAQGQFLKKLLSYLSRQDDHVQITREYQDWRKICELSKSEINTVRRLAQKIDSQPLISIIMPVYNPKQEHLIQAIDSVIDQYYENWELCIADDCSTKSHVQQVLTEYQKKDPRIKIKFNEKNAGISAASNSALQLASGEFIALLDHDDWLEPYALFCIARCIDSSPQVDFIYSDEDKVDEKGGHIDPFFKPGWSPEYLDSCMYTCHFTAYRKEKVIEAGGFRSEFDFAQDYDLALRMSLIARRIEHIPEILYHWRILPGSTAMDHEQKPIAHLRAQKALQQHLNRRGIKGRVEDGVYSGVHRVRYDISSAPLVSIVIPTASGKMSFTREGKTQEEYLLQHCCESVLNSSSYTNIEIIVVDNNDMPEELKQYCDSQPRIKVLHYTDEFNLAKKMNMGVDNSNGEFVILLNDDIEVINSDWIECLLEFGQLPGMGAVGAKLHFADGRLQHAGVAMPSGNPGHLYYLYPQDYLGYFNSAVCPRNYIAVTGACMLTRRSDYLAVGGFSEEFDLNYNDLDYCLKMLESGKRVCMNPYARLYHFESMTKSGTFDAEIELFHNKWLKKFPDDEYYNKNFDREGYEFRVGKSPSPLKAELLKITDSVSGGPQI